MKQHGKSYPDISDIFQRKAEGRRDIARRSFGEKIAMMEALRERLAPFKRLREERLAAKEAARTASVPHRRSPKSPLAMASTTSAESASDQCTPTRLPINPTVTPEKARKPRLAML